MFMVGSFANIHPKDLAIAIVNASITNSQSGVQKADVSSRELGKNEQQNKQQNRGTQKRERKCAPRLVNHRARGSEKALPISPVPAVSEPHAKRPSASQPVEMHANVIITAPMTNKRSEPIANLRSHGIISTNLRHLIAIRRKLVSTLSKAQIPIKGRYEFLIYQGLPNRVS